MQSLRHKSIVIYLISIAFILISCNQSIEQLLDKAYRLSQEKKYDKSIKIYTEVIKRNNRIQAAYYYRGYVYQLQKKYDQALQDFNKVMALQTHGDFTFTYNKNGPITNVEIRTQIDYNDALYQRAQVKFFMDSLAGSLSDFQFLISKGYEKSNCLVWQGTIWIKTGTNDKACESFIKSKKLAETEFDKEQADSMIKSYCPQN